MEISLDITLRDIQEGTPRNAFCCAVAKCIARTQPGMTVKVTADKVTWFTNKGTREAFPSIALSAFIRRFDQGDAVEPVKSALYFFESRPSERKRLPPLVS